MVIEVNLTKDMRKNNNNKTYVNNKKFQDLDDIFDDSSRYNRNIDMKIW